MRAEGIANEQRVKKTELKVMLVCGGAVEGWKLKEKKNTQHKQSHASPPRKLN